MDQTTSIKSLFIIFFTFYFSLSKSRVNSSPILEYNVVNFGAKSNPKIDSTISFLNAWTAACASSSASVEAIIYVPRGKYLIHQAVFTGKCRNNRHITFQIDGTLLAPRDYNAIGNNGKWIVFEYVSGVSIKGGILDGRGMPLWACKLAGRKCPEGATSLLFTNSKDITVSGLTSINSQMFNIVINFCQNVKVHGVNVKSPGNSPNTDGIHVQGSTNVEIIKANINTGDDCISIGPGTSNLWIEHISCGPGHGISIGSLGRELNEPGVHNVTVKTVAFSGTENGVRIKSWGRPSHGFVQGVLFEDVTMNNVNNPIIIDQNYCPHNEDCPDQTSGVKISGVTYRNIRGTSATKIAVDFDCSKKQPCRDITMENVNLTYKNQPAISSCNNADGSTIGVVEPTSCLEKI